MFEPGKKKFSSAYNNSLDLLREIVQRNPTMNKEGHILEFVKQMRLTEFKKFRDQISAEWAQLRYCMVSNTTINKLTKKRDKEPAKKRMELAWNHLMDLKTSLGKKLGDCTREDFLKMSSTYSRLAKIIPEGKTLRETDPKKVRKILGGLI